MNYFQRIAVFLVFITTSYAGVAQNSSNQLSGTIFTTDSLPVYANVNLVFQNKGTHTNQVGYFSISSIKPIKDTLEITYLGTIIKRIPVDFSLGQNYSFGVILLNHTHQALQEVFVNSDISKNTSKDLTTNSTRINIPVQDLAQSITILNAETLKDRMELNFKDIIDEVAGMNHYSGYDEYAFRGLKAENAKMINGLRGFNSTYTSNLLANIEKVEILKGPVSSLYGNGDPGGSVNLITKKPLNFVKNELSMMFGAWNHFRILGDFNKPLNESKSLSLRMNVAIDQSNSFRDYLSNKSYQLAPSISYKPNDKLSFNADFSFSSLNGSIDRGQPGLLKPFPLNATPIKLSTTQIDDYLKEKTFISTLWMHYQLKKNLLLHIGYSAYLTDQKAAGHGIHSYVSNDSVNLYYSKWDYASMTHNFSPYIQYNVQKGRILHQIISGYDFIRTEAEPEQTYFENTPKYSSGSGIVGGFNLLYPNYINRNTSLYTVSKFSTDAAKIEPAVYTTQGLYIQDHMQTGRWIFLMGMRQEIYIAEDETDPTKESIISSTLPRLGITYKMNDQNNLFATYSKGFDPFEVSASTQIFKDPFKPVNSTLFELGLKRIFFDEKLTANFSLYNIRLQNVAVNANDITNPNLFVQRGEHTSTGFETEWNGNPLPDIYLNLTYAYNVAKISKSIIQTEIGQFVENAPMNSSSSWVKYQPKKSVIKNWAFVFGHTQVSKRYLVQREIILPGYLTLQAGLRYIKPKWSISMNVYNITNKTYWIGGYNSINKWPGAPRNTSIQFSYRF